MCGLCAPVSYMHVTGGFMLACPDGLRGLLLLVTGVQATDYPNILWMSCHGFRFVRVNKQ
jgi:hypothetical protein